MTNQGADIQHPKLRGEWAELRFMARAAEHGLCVAKPWGDTTPYDFAVEHNGHFLRVQVKCTNYRRSRSYECDVTASHVPYSADRLDFFAVYVIQPDVWYIIPFAATNGRARLILSPHRATSKYGKYREAWHLLRGSAETCPWREECRQQWTAHLRRLPTGEQLRCIHCGHSSKLSS